MHLVRDHEGHAAHRHASLGSADQLDETSRRAHDHLGARLPRVVWRAVWRAAESAGARVCAGGACADCAP
jgi:hypothetical protein